MWSAASHANPEFSSKAPLRKNRRGSPPGGAQRLLYDFAMLFSEINGDYIDFQNPALFTPIRRP
jgi:hypothetical protein